MIRLPDIPQQPATTIGAPLISQQALAAPAHALGSLATTIAGVSDAFSAEALRIQRIENARMVSEARRGLAESYAAFQSELQSDPDPESRILRTREFLGNAKGMMQPADAPPEVLDTLSEHFEDFASKAVIHQTADSAKLTHHRAELSFRNEIAAARSSGDVTALENAISNAESAGIILPEEGEPIRRSFHRERDLQTIEGAIMEEPSLVLHDIDNPDFRTRFPNITSDDIPKLKRFAKQHVENRRSEELDLIQNALNAGELTPKDLEAATYLTPRDISVVKKALVRTMPPDTSHHAAAWDLLFALRDKAKDPGVSDVDYAAAWNDTRTKVLSLLPPGLQGDVAQELSYRSPANRKLEKDEPERAKSTSARSSDFKSLATQRIKKAYDEGTLGNIDDPESESAKLAYTRFEDARVALSRFIDANPDADYPSIRDFVSQALGSTLTDGKPVITIPKFSPPVSFDARATSALGMPPGSAEASAALLPPP
jgi:hypothetical protein